MNGAQPLVSVIIPVYNVRRFLREAVESVLRQTFRDWELILVDDGSTDDSGAICDEYAREDGRVRVIHQENRGISCARNAGMRAARGTWYFFVDGDDWVEADALEKLLAHSQDADVVVGHYPQKRPPWRNVDAPRAFCPQEATQEERAEMFFLKLFSPVWSRLYRRERIDGWFEEGMTYGEDVDFNLKQWRNWRRIVFIPDVTYHYRLREDSLSFVLRIDRMEQVRESLRLFGKMFPDGSAVMDTLSRWYVIELRLYLRYYAGQQSVPVQVRRLMLEMWLGDETFDHGRISTALLNRELRMFWDAVLRRDADALLEMLENG